jgi:hypothetical protein
MASVPVSLVPVYCRVQGCRTSLKKPMTPLSPLLITDYAKNDVNFVLSVLSLEELGARGNKGLAGLVNNPVHSAAIAGLATSATAQATIEVRILSF